MTKHNKKRQTDLCTCSAPHSRQATRFNVNRKQSATWQMKLLKNLANSEGTSDRARTKRSSIHRSVFDLFKQRKWQKNVIKNPQKQMLISTYSSLDHPDNIVFFSFHLATHAFNEDNVFSIFLMHEVNWEIV